MSTFAKHLDAIRSGAVDRSNVIGIRKALNMAARRSLGLSGSRTAPKATDEELELLVDLLAEHRPRVVGELHDSGIKQLTDKRYRRQLQSVADVVDNLAGFRLVGFEYLGRDGLYTTPVYRAEGANGGSFAFINVPWQSGGNGPEPQYSGRW